jgi:putative transposase
MKKRFRDEQIITMIKEQESEERTADACRRHALRAGFCKQNLAGKW